MKTRMAVRASRARRFPPGGPPARLGLHLERGMKVGLFGGTFDPAHAGHKHAAETARRRLGLDRVIWLVSPGNPLKAAPAGLARRAASAAAFARGRAQASDAESRLGVRYSIDTVRKLKARFPGVRFVWIIGGDGLRDLHFWRDWTGLMREIAVAVVARPGATLAGLAGPAARRFASARVRSPAALLRRRPPAWIWLTGPWNRLSSTALRAAADRIRGAC